MAPGEIAVVQRGMRFSVELAEVQDKLKLYCNAGRQLSFLHFAQVCLHRFLFPTIYIIDISGPRPRLRAGGVQRPLPPARPRRHRCVLVISRCT